MKKEKILSAVIFAILYIAIFYFFHKQIETLITNSSLVKQILVIKTNTFYTLISFISIIVLLGYLFFKYNFEFSTKIYFFPILCTSIYLFERKTEFIYLIECDTEVNKISFASIYGVDFLKYFDIIIIFIDAIFLRQFFKKTEPKVNKEHDGFFEDLELTDLSKTDDDLLKYGNYAVRIAKNIEKSNFEKAFAIGITGEWGSGKTSFINLIKKYFKGKSDFIFIEFNPWNSNNPNQIIPNFFDTIQESLVEKNIFIRSDISKYLSKISQVELGFLGETFKPIVNGFTDNFSVEDLKNRISDKIVSKNKKIIISIDDLDRLNKHEINEVLKLIRNTANFSNVCYLVAYDRNYVINFLQDDFKFDFKNYLEKIFQLEVNLPLLEKKVLVDKLKKNLREFVNDSIPAKLKIQFERQIDYVSEYSISVESIENLRDITRLSNAILMNYLPIIGEVDFFDFINLEILRMKHNEVYELLKKDKYSILQNSKKQDDITNKKNELKLLEKEKIKVNVKEEKAIKLLEKIFSENINYRVFKEYDITYLNKLRTPSRFGIYFKYTVYDNLLSLNQLVNSLNDETKFKEFIEQSVKDDKEFQLNEYFEINDSFDNIETYKNFIKGLFYFSSQTSKIRAYTFRNLIFFDSERIYYKLIRKPDFFKQEDFEKFYSEIFEVKQADNETFIKLNFLIDLLNNHKSENWIISEEKTLVLFKKIMQLYISDCFTINDEFDKIFQQIRAINKNFDVEECINLFVGLIKGKIIHNLRQTFRQSFVKYSTRAGENYWTIHVFVRDFLTDLSNFKGFLEKEVSDNLKKEAFYIEYLRFLSEIIEKEKNSTDREYKHASIDVTLFD